MGLGLAAACTRLPWQVPPPPPRVARIGYLDAGSASSLESSPEHAAFRQGLHELGYIEGQNIAIEYRFAEGRDEAFPALAADLVASKIDVIVTAGVQAVRAAKDATSTIPIVMAAVRDAVRDELVASLARPGGNVTGLTNLQIELTGKQMQLLKEAVPTISHVLVIRGTVGDVTETEAAARALSLTARTLSPRSVDDFAPTFEAAAAAGVDALVMPPSPFNRRYRALIVDLAAKHRLPAIYGFREAVDDGGLMSYGPSLPAMYRRAATFVDKILKGANPADLPVERPTTFDFVVNLHTAQALGLDIPQDTLKQVTEVIR